MNDDQGISSFGSHGAHDLDHNSMNILINSDIRELKLRTPGQPTMLKDGDCYKSRGTGLFGIPNFATSECTCPSGPSNWYIDGNNLQAVWNQANERITPPDDDDSNPDYPFYDLSPPSGGAYGWPLQTNNHPKIWNLFMMYVKMTAYDDRSDGAQMRADKDFTNPARTGIADIIIKRMKDSTYKQQNNDTGSIYIYHLSPFNEGSGFCTS